MSSRCRWSLRIGAAIPVVLALLLSPSAAFAEEEEIPTIDKESVSGITSTGAILEAQISPHSGNGADYQFQLVTDPEEYASEILCPEPPWGFALCIGPVGEGALPIRYIFKEATPVSLDLSEEEVTLQPGTTYHYRVLAARSAITEDTIEWEEPTVFGPDQTFTTLEEEPTGPTNLRPLTLKKSAGGTGGTGTVSSKPKGINCSAACDEAVAEMYENSVVVLKAKASTGSTIASWTGCATSTGVGGVEGSCEVTMSAAKEVKVAWSGTSKEIISAKPLTFSKGATEGKGTVKAYGSLTCEAECSSTTVLYQGSVGAKAGKTVTLKEVPAFGSEFSGWSGCESEPEGNCVVTMETAKSVSAEFALKPTATLTLNKGGTGSGTVSSKPKAINCGATCTTQDASVPTGETIVLKAKASTGMTLSSWSGCKAETGVGTAEGTCTVSLSGASAVTASFSGTAKAIASAQKLTLTKAGSGHGAVKAAGLTCEALCTSTVSLYQGPTTKPGKTVTLKAVSAPGSKTVVWSGCDSEPEGNCVVTMESAKNVTATFDELE
jgi:Divergent InlB B-repeat domain